MAEAAQATSRVHPDQGAAARSGPGRPRPQPRRRGAGARDGPHLPIGLVGPCSNAVGSAQQVPVDYNHLENLDGWAWEWGKAHDGQREDTHKLVGFCLLFKRERVERVGLFDEQFGIGNFEDDDFCLRAKRAGYRAMIARDAFIHHFGSRTFAGAGIDLDALLVKNQQLFHAKWGPQGSRHTPCAVALPVAEFARIQDSSTISFRA